MKKFIAYILSHGEFFFPLFVRGLFLILDTDCSNSEYGRATLPIELLAMIFASTPDYYDALSLCPSRSHFWHAGKTHIRSIINNQRLLDRTADNDDGGCHSLVPYWSCD